MKHQIYALTTALIITIIGLIVTIDYFNGEVKRLDNDIQSLVNTLHNHSESIKFNNDYNIRNEYRLKCFGTTIYGSAELSDMYMNTADKLLDSLINSSDNSEKR